MQPLILFQSISQEVLFLCHDFDSAILRRHNAVPKYGLSSFLSDSLSKNKKEVNFMNFGKAIEALKDGKMVARKGWNGKGMYLYLINGTELQKTLKYGYGEYENEPTITDSIAMKTAQNTIVVGWLASQTDMLAEDWEIIN